MSAARETFVQNDAQTIREALAWITHEPYYADEIAEAEARRDAALSALDRLEELAT